RHADSAPPGRVDGYRVQPGLHRGRVADVRARLRPDRGSRAGRCAKALRVDLRVRHSGRPHLALPRDPSPAELPAGRRLTSSVTPNVSAAALVAAADRLLGRVSHW